MEMNVGNKFSGLNNIAANKPEPTEVDNTVEIKKTKEGLIKGVRIQTDKEGHMTGFTRDGNNDDNVYFNDELEADGRYLLEEDVGDYIIISYLDENGERQFYKIKQ